MAFTTPSKTTTIASFSRRYPTAGSSWAGDLYDRAYNWALDRADIRLSSVTITILENVREYDLSAMCLRVESVEWYTRADYYEKINGRVSRQWLDANASGWRAEEAQIPSSYYITSSESTGNLTENILGFRELMSAAPSGGYPVAIVRGQFVDAMSGSDTLPPILRDDTAILHKMYHLYAVEKDPKNAMLYERIAEQSAREMQSRVQRLQDEAPRRLISGARFAPRRSY